MQVRDAMTEQARYIPSTASLKDAARTMQEMDSGFLPVGDTDNDRIQGVVTDRDIVLRAVARGLDIDNTPVSEVQSGKVLYCFADDELEAACDSMQSQQVHRLIVLDNREDKQLAGVISLGDIVRHGQGSLAERALEGIQKDAA